MLTGFVLCFLVVCLQVVCRWFAGGCICLLVVAPSLRQYRFKRTSCIMLRVFVCRGYCFIYMYVYA